MTSIIRKTLVSLALVAFYSGTVGATAIAVTGSSLKGSTGELDVALVSGTNYDVTWSLDTTGFDDVDANATNHTFLTEVAFKISGMTSVILLDSVGTLYFPSNVNNGGCNTSGSPAGFACVSLSPFIDATIDQVISVHFNVELDSVFDFENDSISFRGKYGEGNGWVISESAKFVPEPTTLALLGLGLFGLGFNKRKIVH